MANSVTNKLRFDKCSKERCREILEAIQIESIGLGSIDFNKIIPEPYFPSDQDCINWRIKNWDTKWEAYGYRNGIQYDEDKNEIGFLTANRSARKIIIALSRQYPDVLFELRYADENFGYNVGEISICAGEDFDGRIPKENTYEAQKLAADIMGFKHEFDIESRSGYVRQLDANLYEYCEGVHVSQSFQCDQSLGHPVVLCYDFDNSKVWLEMYPLLDEDDDMYEDIKNSIQAWGIHPCETWDDFNSYVQCLGDDAMEAAYYDEGGMTMC